MGLFGTKNDKPAGASVAPSGSGQAQSSTRMSGAPQAQGESPRVGIDHAITLLRSLPTEKNATLVVTVLKTTLESLGIRVADIVEDAAKRLAQIEARNAQLKSEIATLEQEIAKRSEEIARMEAAHAETTKVKDYLESEEAEILPNSKP